MGRFARLTDEFLRKMENHAAERIGLRKGLRVKLRLIAYAIGIVDWALDGTSSIGAVV